MPTGSVCYMLLDDFPTSILGIMFIRCSTVYLAISEQAHQMERRVSELQNTESGYKHGFYYIYKTTNS